MSISQKQYASEVIDVHGKALKFDDIACMQNYIKNRKPDVAATFVVDYETGAWLKAEEAYFVKSDQFKTPMSGSIVAFSNRKKAQATAAEYQGKELRNADL
jgi:copper chaperone NosL